MKVSTEFNVWVVIGLGLFFWVFLCVFVLFLSKNDKTQNIINMDFGGRLFLWFTPEMLLS